MKVVRKVGDKGQITIPKEIRDVMDIEDGDIVEFEIVAVHIPKTNKGKHHGKKVTSRNAPDVNPSGVGA